MTEKCECNICHPNDSNSYENTPCTCHKCQPHHSHDYGAEKFLKLADEAWMEILKEKIKIQIENQKGERMNKLAEIIAKSNGEKWKHKLASKMGCEEFKSEIREFYSKK